MDVIAPLPVEGVRALTQPAGPGVTTDESQHG